MATGWFDAASGLPWTPVTLAALSAAAEDGWADPGRLSGPGRRSAQLLDAARETMAAELGARPDEVVFTPSGDHARQLAVLGTLAGRRRVGERVVHSAVEHSTTLKATAWHVEHGGRAESIGVDGEARVDADAFRAAVRVPGTAAAVLQAANHEVGTRQPVIDTGEVPLVVDAAHSLLYGRPPEHAAVFTADARLWGGPDLGVLVIRRGTRWRPPFPADESERARGLGVPNVPAAVAAAASLRAFRSAAQPERLHELVARLREAIPAAVADTVVLGASEDRLPHLVTFSSLYLDGEALLTELDRRGFAVSSGSSCTADTLTPSHVLVAMGALTSGNVRVSLPPEVEPGDVDRFVRAFTESVAVVRAQLPRSAPSAGDPAAAGPTADATAPEPLVDSRGRRCPLPILDLARALPGRPIGAELVILADDPAAGPDIAAWCRMTGQELVSGQDGAFRIRRRH